MNAAISLCYIIAGICFILGLKLLGRTESARLGNRVSALGMTAAVAGAFLVIVREHDGQLQTEYLIWIVPALIVGGAIGAITAQRVAMTAMPELVALFNGFGGIASLLVGWSQLQSSAAPPPFTAATIFLAMLIGGVTFTGSLMAYGKLSERLPSRPLTYPGQNIVNGAMLVGLIAGGCWFAGASQLHWIFLAGVVLSLLLGIAIILPIGGADMPVVISLLNSYSGLAACAAGFAIGNVLLIVTGALVGAAGIILTRIMCKAMNRPLSNVLFSGFGAPPSAQTTIKDRTTQSLTTDSAYYLLEAAQSIVFVPGYGMAVAQAQHVVRELAEIMERNGTEVRFAVHPVAGRMPGHMNVLLAEADVPYEQMVEMDDINPVMETVDVAIVLGANDVVNPASRDDANSPIYGMPVIEVDRARTVIVMKRSMASGFAGIENPLFFKDNSHMLFGDAKKTIEALIGEFKESV